MRMRVSGSVAGRQALTQAVDDGGEGVLLDEVQQLLFGLEIIIKTGQRDAAQARKIAHGGAFVTFVGENLGGVIQNLGQAAVETGIEGAGRAVEEDVAVTAGFGSAADLFLRTFVIILTGREGRNRGGNLRQ